MLVRGGSAMTACKGSFMIGAPINLNHEKAIRRRDFSESIYGLARSRSWNWPLGSMHNIAHPGDSWGQPPQPSIGSDSCCGNYRACSCQIPNQRKIIVDIIETGFIRSTRYCSRLDEPFSNPILSPSLISKITLLARG